MSSVLSFRGMPQCLAMLDQFTGRQLQNRMRRAVYAGAKEFQGAISAAAQARHGSGDGNVPASFSKVGAPKVSTHGGASGRDIEAYVRPKSPLFNIFEPGAQAHEISPNSSVTARPGRRGGKARKPALAGYGGGFDFWTPASRKRGKSFYSTKPVKHPGMRARPILPGAFAARIGAAENTVAAALFGNIAGVGGVG